MAQSPISFAFVDGRPLFLDLDEDSYFLLEPEAERLFELWLEEGAVPECAPEELAQALGAGRPILGPVSFARPLQSALAGRPGSCTLADVAMVWKLIRKARSDIRQRPLATILGELPKVMEAPSGQDSPALAARFATARRLAPVSGNCLSQSLALMRWLAARGRGAALVFGAKLDPFAAHCWVQSGEQLLNDHPDRVERFTPIRVVECTPAMR